MVFQHGGDLYTARESYSGTLLDFSVNIHPLGAPRPVLEAASQAVLLAEQYPDPSCRALRHALAEVHSIPEDWILCGNGASELISALAMGLRPQEALLTAPTFSEYARALTAVGCRVHHFPLKQEENFALTQDFLPYITAETELVFLCNPNNPTGRLIPPSLLTQILHRCHRTDTILVVDECFLPLAVPGEGLVPALAENPNLLLLRAFTKTHAIPGLRLGYCLSSNTALLGRLGDVLPCWNLSLVAQSAGLACCRAWGWPEEARALLEKERPLLMAELKKLGMTVVPGDANFLLFHCPGDTTLQDRMLNRGILIRSCGNYSGLGPDWYRVAVCRTAENRRLLQGLQQVMQKEDEAWQR